MVPLKLSLKNFMCYKNATLDLEGIHLACLSGDNGAGKSALLDAMTWTLWGKARATPDELIAQGEIEMQTDFEFYINETVYRIVRTRTRKGAGHTELSFQIQTHEGGWRNIGGNTVKATQDQIVKELRMEYETFINSAFLLQGRADEFTTKTPGERKKVLAEILGLEYYDQLEAQAKDQAKEADLRRRRLDEDIQRIDEELDKRPFYEQQKEQTETGLKAGKESLAKNESELSLLEQRENLLKLKEEQRQTSLKRLNNAKQELARLDKKLEEAERNIDLCNQVISRREEIEKGYGEYTITYNLYEALLGKFHRYQQLLERRRALQDVIKRSGMRLEAEQHQVEMSIKETAELSRHLPALEKDFAGLKQEIARANQAGEQLEQAKASRQEKVTEQKLLAEDIKRVDKLLKEIEEKAKQTPQAGERCDRCGTLMDNDAREHVLQERRNEYKAQKEERNLKKQRQEALVVEVESLEKKVRELEPAAQRLNALQKRVGSVERELEQARQAGEKLAGLEARQQEIKRQLEKEDYCQGERAELREVDRQSKELAYDDSERQNLKTRLDALRKFEQEKNALDDAQRRIVTLKEDATHYRQDYKDLKREEAELQIQVEGLEVEVAELPTISARRSAAQNLKAEAENEVKRLEKTLWDFENKLRQCDQLAVDKKKKSAEHAKAAREKDIYTELASAFGKKGVQALIIDTVLPELEDEANKLLGNMSDGRMSVRFETLRDSKRGDAIETLDLRISDEAGVRSYELFSGGEAFRVNFAVRVALSKLLARRSGAALRTLVIDEGFGSQDGQGRERLVEAIRSIEQDFERVLVITHIQELKDVFPVRIDVVKTPGGSTISVN
ncbi:MAG TPA: SMC family ATPase [Chloroflexia bacterium]|nr:SMC family ATPase [Chloroflexia bacterium]